MTFETKRNFRNEFKVGILKDVTEGSICPFTNLNLRDAALNPLRSNIVDADEKIHWIMRSTFPKFN